MIMRPVLLLFLLCYIFSLLHSVDGKMPTSILAFRHHAEELRLYAAVLAATESFRLQRDEVKDYYSLTLHEEDAFI